MMFASLQVRMVVCLNPNADDYDESVVRGPKQFLYSLYSHSFMFWTLEQIKFTYLF